MRTQTPTLLLFFAVCLCPTAVADAPRAEITCVRVNLSLRKDFPPRPIDSWSSNAGHRQDPGRVASRPHGYTRQLKYDLSRRDQWMFAAPASVFLFYMIAWFWIGPELKPGPIVPRYEPPDGLSAAAVRFIALGTTDGRSFAAVIATLAVHGCIRVEPIDGKYKLSRLLGDRTVESALAPEEKRILTLLFEDGPVIELTPAMDQRNTAQNGMYINSIHEELSRQFSGKYFTRHYGIIGLGLLATFAFALGLALAVPTRNDFVAIFFLTVWVLFFGLFFGLMIEFSFASAWKSAARARTGWVKLFPGTLAILVFGGAIVFLLQKLAAEVSHSFAFTLAAFLLINIGWGPRLKRRTKLGHEVSDQTAGFRQFLAKVEQDRLNRLNPQNLAPQDLDRFLPFAIALEVKEAWGDHFAQAFFAPTAFLED